MSRTMTPSSESGFPQGPADATDAPSTGDLVPADECDYARLIKAVFTRSKSE